MPALFPEWATSVFRAALVLALLSTAASLGGLLLYVRSPYNTDQYRSLEQPVHFDHRHHVRDDGIRCRFCHIAAENSPDAGVPTAAVCMGCHNQIWVDSPLLDPVRRSYFSGKPIRWRRVYALADFVYFDHSTHVRHGVDCVYCHGRVDQMARVYRAVPLQMKWCLDCHRNPKSRLSASSMGPALDPVANSHLDSKLKDTRSVTRITTCSACHR